MDRKVILSRYIKAIYRDVNKIIMCLVTIKNLGKSKRIHDSELFRRMAQYKPTIMGFIAHATNDIEDFYKWVDSGCAMFGIEQEEKTNLFTFRTRKGDIPSDEVVIDRESIISVEKHFSGGALIKYTDGEDKEVVTFEKFNEVISQLGFEVEYKNGRYITKEKSSKSIKVSELKDKLDEILGNNGDIELEATFSVVRGDDDYKIRNTGDINRTIEFCKRKIEKPIEKESKPNLNDYLKSGSIYINGHEYQFEQENNDMNRPVAVAGDIDEIPDHAWFNPVIDRRWLFLPN